MEKLLKALVVKATGQVPPRTHNLVWLLALSHLNLPHDQEQFLSKLILEYIETRYPEELESVAALNSRSAAEGHLQQTETLFQCLEAKTKQS